MVAIQSVAHFSIPVSDVAESTRFYTEIVGCRHLATVAGGTMAFLDAAGICLILVKRDPPINPRPQDHGGVHHAFAVAHELRRRQLAKGGRQWRPSPTSSHWKSITRTPS